MTYEEFNRAFATDDDCKAYIVAKRWPDGVRCPRCNRKEKVYKLKAPFRWTCCNADCGKRAGYRFSVTTHTIFEDTKVSLRIWFQIGYLMWTAKKGLSSLQVRRVIFGEDSGTDWRTAWYICHRWRAAMKGDAFPLTGEVEVDETLCWRESAQHARQQAKGARLDRHKEQSRSHRRDLAQGDDRREGDREYRHRDTGRIRPPDSFKRREADCDRRTLRLSTLGRGHESPRDHVTAQGEYVVGTTHTNNIEGFWSLFKRGIIGSYHKVNKEYLPPVCERIRVALQQSKESRRVRGFDYDVR